MASEDAGGLPVIKNDVILEVHLWKWLKATENNGAGVSTRRGFPVIEPPGERLPLKVRVEPCYRLAPGIPGRFRTVAASGIAVESVPAPRIHVEFVLFAMLG